MKTYTLGYLHSTVRVLRKVAFSSNLARKSHNLSAVIGKVVYGVGPIAVSMLLEPEHPTEEELPVVLVTVGVW